MSTEVIRRNYKYLLIPNREQRHALNRVKEIHRQLYNAALQERRIAWKKGGIAINYADQTRQLKEMRQFDDEVAWLNFSSIQQTLRRVDKAFRGFFKRLDQGEKTGFPRFKSERRFDTVEYRYGAGAEVVTNNDRVGLEIQNIGTLKIKYHREIPPNARITTLRLKQTGLKWYAIFSLVLAPNKSPGNQTHTSTNPTNIEMGLHTLLKHSNSILTESTHWLRRNEQRLFKWQDDMARRCIGSSRWQQARHQVANLTHQLDNRRCNLQHQLVDYFSKTFGMTVLEEINSIQELSERSWLMLVKSVPDRVWQRLISLVDHKAAEAGGLIGLRDSLRTNRLCESCGELVCNAHVEHEHCCHQCGAEVSLEMNPTHKLLLHAIEDILARTEPALRREHPD